MKRILFASALIIVIVMVLVLFVIYNTTCMFDGMGIGYYVERNNFETEFSNFDINISPGFSFSNNKLDLNTKRGVSNFAKENAIAYETHSCSGSSYYIKSGETFVGVSREEMHSKIDEVSGCDGCSVLVGYAMGNIIIKQE